MTAPSPIRFDALHKHFGDVRAVDGIDLEVGAGEIVGFLGPNGAGKSTSVRALLGLLRPTSGRALLRGRPGSEPAARVGVGYIPSDVDLDPKRTVGEVLELLGRLRGGVPRSAWEPWCERFRLDPTRKAGELSTGNRRKAAIVQAMMIRPAILVLDEPTSGLDPLLQEEFHRAVREARDGGAAVLLSSHVLSEVDEVADRVAIIRRGRLVAVDSMEGLRSRVPQTLTLVLERPPELDPARVAGVSSWRVEGTTVTVSVSGAVQPVLDALAPSVIRRITSADDLEQIFLAFYRDEGEEGAAPSRASRDGEQGDG